MVDVLLVKFRNRFETLFRQLHRFRREGTLLARGSHYTTVRRSKKIGLLDHTGYGNLGDDTTQTAVMQNIKQRWPGSVICGFSCIPTDTELRHGITCYAIRRKTQSDAVGIKSRVKSALSKHRFLLEVLKTINVAFIHKPKALFSESVFLVRSFKIIRTFDILIISGGGQLLDSWGGPWQFPYTIFKWVLLAKLSGAKCYFLNVGAGPLEFPLSRVFFNRALHLADYVSFRDQRSKALMREVGFKGEAQVFPDCVYGLNTLPNNPNRIGVQDKPLVGISPMAYCDPRRYYIRDQLAYEGYIRKLALFSSWLSRRCDLTLFSTEVWFDLQAMEELNVVLTKGAGMDGGRLVFRDPITNTSELLSQMSSMDYIITSRFHGVVFAHLLNIPVVAISHHPKVHTLMSNLGLAEYCLDIDTFDPGQLTVTFDRMMIDREIIKTSMAENAAIYRDELARQFDQLFFTKG